MSMRRRKLVIAGLLVILAIAGWFAYAVVHRLQHIPEAYAAWDTGTLLIEYMKTHNNHWPSSWDDLLTVLDSESGRQIPLRGAQAGDVGYARSLSSKINVDWTFDPATQGDRLPVSPSTGGKFTLVWTGAEPNQMIREYLTTRPTTQPAHVQ